MHTHTYIHTHSHMRCAGILLYFVDGVLPLLRSFFDNLFSLPDEGEDDRDMQLSVTNSLLSNLMVSTDGSTAEVKKSFHYRFCSINSVSINSEENRTATLSNVRIVSFVSFRSVLMKCAHELRARAAVVIAAPTSYCDRSPKAGKEERLFELH